MQPVSRGATHDKLTIRSKLRTDCDGFATPSDLCLLPPSHVPNVLPWRSFPLYSLVFPCLFSASAPLRCDRASALVRVVGAFRRIIGGRLVELTIQRRAADFQ